MEPEPAPFGPTVAGAGAMNSPRLRLRTKLIVFVAEENMLNVYYVESTTTSGPQGTPAGPIPYLHEAVKWKKQGRYLT